MACGPNMIRRSGGWGFLSYPTKFPVPRQVRCWLLRKCFVAICARREWKNDLWYTRVRIYNMICVCIHTPLWRRCTARGTRWIRILKLNRLCTRMQAEFEWCRARCIFTGKSFCELTRDDENRIIHLLTENVSPRRGLKSIYYVLNKY